MRKKNVSQKSIKRFRKEVKRITETNEPLYAMQMFKQILIMPFKMRFMVAMKIIFRFEKKKTKNAPALTQKFQEYRNDVKQLIEVK
jgi:hypothetical protein